ncbi:hypothetical protein KAR91_28120 [Candidatus Pacearchaeota archaeon]|nr:hypothetical protein [Candidatus Pacearchaeota archaeon]
MKGDSLEQMIEACQIFLKYKDQYQGLHGEHDIIYSGIYSDVIPEDSEDGKRLVELGWHQSSEGDMWGLFC